MNPTDQAKLLSDVDAFCQELRPIEELCYVEHRYNDQVIPLATKYKLMAMPAPVELGGRGADTVTYTRALARIGREGTGVRTKNRNVDTCRQARKERRFSPSDSRSRKPAAILSKCK